MCSIKNTLNKWLRFAVVAFALGAVAWVIEASASVGPEEALHRSSRRTAMVISEVMYQPSDPALAFVELFNSSPLTKDLSGWRLGGAILYTFPAGTIVTGRSFLVVALDPIALESAYGLTGVHGPYDGSLHQASGDVYLYNRLGGLVLEAAYDARYPWPAAPAGGGHSLVLARPSYGEGTREAWAASALKGGSPGAHEPAVSDPLDGVVINEFLAHTDEPDVDFVELFNTSDAPIDLSGAWLSDKADTNRFQIPGGTVLPPGGFLTYDETELGFALAAAGEAVFLVNPDDTRVIDAIHYDAQANGISMGRYPDGAPEFRLLATPTPGDPNTDPYWSPVIINEIMFNPISGDDADTYVELYNRGAEAIDMSDWRFVEGISFTIPDGVTLAPGDYLVIAKDRDRLIDRYPQLHSGNTLGDFGGRLANSGERLALAMPSFRSELPTDYVTVDEVHYRDGGRWGEWANRDGSSLELRDPRGNNRLAANWTHSDESAKSEWVLIEHTGVLDHGQGPANQLHIIMPSAGDVLIDNVEVRIGDGPNLVANSTFESGLQDWAGFGHHETTHWHDTEGFESGASLRVQASGGGDTGGNRVRVALNQTLESGQTVTIRARARWLAGHHQVLLRLKGNYLEVMGDLHIPSNLGTPGLPNSALESNIGPAVYDVRQTPVLPDAHEPVSITARADDPDGVTAMTLFYRIDPAPSYTSVSMTSQAGVYYAEIPGQAADTLVAYYIEATDGHASPATATYPDDPSKYEALIRFGMAHEPGLLKTYHLWFTQAVMDEWSSRPALSNRRLPGTVVYGERIIHGIGARYRGSPWRRQGDPSGYSFQTPRDDRLLGVREFNLNATHENDSTGQREFLGYWIADQMGVQTPHSTFVHVRVNGVPSTLMSGIFTDVHHINSDYVQKWFPDDDEGEMFKGNDWFEFRDNFTFKFNVNARLERYLTTDGAYKQARYRWNWNKRSNRGLDDDYSRFFQLVDAVNTQGRNAYNRAVNSIVDIEQWMRVFAARRVVSEWDGYGYDRGKDAWLYKAASAPWQMLLWDLDKGLGSASDANASLFGAEDPTVNRMYDHPEFRRMYLRAIYEALHGPMQAARIDPVMDEVHAALQANGISADGPADIKGWLNQRRNSISGQLGWMDQPFSLNSWGDSHWTVAYLYGIAPLSVETITVNGIAYPVEWWSAIDWFMMVPLEMGENDLLIQAWNSDGTPIGEEVLSHSRTGIDPNPADHLIINEIMYDPLIPQTEFIEIHNRSPFYPFDLTGYRLRGVDFDFPPGTLIEPGAYLLVVRNQYALLDAYGPGLPIAGEYNGTLQPGGEQLRLVRLATDTDPEQVIDEVNYSAFFPWPDGARGTGASIQRIHPDQPGDDPANWYAITAATPPDAGWQRVEIVGQVPHNRIYLYLEAPGEVHVDDLALRAGEQSVWGANLITNGNFALPLAGTWTVGANLANSQIVNDVFRSAGASLHVVATAPGSSESTAIAQDRHDVAPTFSGETYTLTYWYLPNTNGAPLTVRYRFSDSNPAIISRTHETTPQPRALATPGATNSVPAGLRAIPTTSLLHYWNFNDTNAVLTPSYTVGGGALAIEPGPATVWLADDGQDFEGINARFGDETGTHLRVNDPLGTEIDAALPTTGYSNIIVRYETRRSGQGAGRQIIEYTTNGMTYNPFTEIEITESTRLQTFDFSAVSGVSDNPDFGVRVTFQMADGGASGNNRFDNWTVEGAAMPGVNVPPIVYAGIPRQVAVENGAPVALDLSTFFVDPDDDLLVFSAQADVSGFADLSVSNQWLTVQGVQRGETEIEVLADDGQNPPVPTTFRLLIYPAPHQLATGPYTFTAWDPNLPERTYPEHMLFLQTDESDTALDSPLDYAYFIPHDQYHANDQGTIGFPYNNTGRSRITGLGQGGIAFINTGQDRDLGGALLALDTRWLDGAVDVDWLAGTVTPNSRIYALRLQYRVGAEGPFIDLLDAQTNVVEYVRNPLAGHAQAMPTVTLPPSALDQPYVQVLWRYYRISGSSGPRAELRLDDIDVAGQPAVTANTGTPHWWLAAQGLEPPFEVAATNLYGVLNRPAWQYHIADLNPNDPATEWPRLQLQQLNDELQLTWHPTSTARIYRVWGVSDLINGAWQAVTNKPGTGAATWTIDVDAAEPTRVYYGDIIVPPSD